MSSGRGFLMPYMLLIVIQSEFAWETSQFVPQSPLVKAVKPSMPVLPVSARYRTVTFPGSEACLSSSKMNAFIRPSEVWRLSRIIFFGCLIEYLSLLSVNVCQAAIVFSSTGGIFLYSGGVGTVVGVGEKTIGLGEGLLVKKKMPPISPEIIIRILLNNKICFCCDALMSLDYLYVIITLSGD